MSMMETSGQYTLHHQNGGNAETAKVVRGIGSLFVRLSVRNISYIIGASKTGSSEQYLSAISYLYSPIQRQ